MEQKTIEKFRIIGASTKIQSITLADELKLLDGILYNFNFSLDYSNLLLNDQPLNETSIHDIVEYITNPEEPETLLSFPSSAESYRQHQEVIEAIQNYEKEARKQKRKWKHRKNKPKNIEDAVKNFNKVRKELMK